MELPYTFMLLGIFFFSFISLVNVVRAYREKENTYYLGAIASFLMALVLFFININQIRPALIIGLFVLSLGFTGFPKMRVVQERKLEKQLKIVDRSSPLRVRDFLTNEGWFKLAFRWGLLRTMCFCYLFYLVVIGGILFLVSTFSFMKLGFAVVYTATFSTVAVFMFYSQLKNVLEVT